MSSFEVDVWHRPVLVFWNPFNLLGLSVLFGLSKMSIVLIAHEPDWTRSMDAGALTLLVKACQRKLL